MLKQITVDVALPYSRLHSSYISLEVITLWWSDMNLGLFASRTVRITYREDILTPRIQESLWKVENSGWEFRQGWAEFKTPNLYFIEEYLNDNRKLWKILLKQDELSNLGEEKMSI